MTRQIGILIRANEYLRKLNKGYDPLSGERLPDSSAACEFDVKKAFFFCSRSLVQIINYDNTETRPAFFITPEQAAGLCPGEGSVELSKLTEHINRATDMLQCRALSRFTVRDWLGKGGFLKKYGRGLWRVTTQGQRLGIAPEGERGLSLDRNAQQFVIDHVQELAAFAGENTGEGERRNRAQVKEPGPLRSNIAAMGRLAGGMHPYRDQPLDKTDPLKQERLQRCFEYTAWALERALKAGYFTAKAPFTLPRELWGEIAVSGEPVVLWDFTRAVDGLLPDPTAVEGLSPVLVREYLVSRGLLRSFDGGKGRRQFSPTAGGSALGIAEGETVSESSGKLYPALLYSAEAQRYIAEHLGEIIELAAAGD